MSYYFGCESNVLSKKLDNYDSVKKRRELKKHYNKDNIIDTKIKNIIRNFNNINFETIITILIIFLISFCLIGGALFVSEYFQNGKEEKILQLPYTRTYNNEFNLNFSTAEIKNIYLSAGGEEVVLMPVKYINYRVSAGDSLWTIAKKFEVSVDSVYSANIKIIKNPHILSAGMVLRIPTNMGIVKDVNSIKEVEDLLSQFDIDELSLLISNGVSTKEELVEKREIFLPNVELPQTEKLKAYGIAFGFPARGYVSSRFGYRKDPFTGLRRFHTGVDIANVWGTAVYAAYDGVVIFVGEKGGYGLCIIISHPLGYSTLYGHLSQSFVKIGQRVSKGSKIAAMGSSGRSTGSHLHFEIRKFGKFLNPLSYTIFK